MFDKQPFRPTSTVFVYLLIYFRFEFCAGHMTLGSLQNGWSLQNDRLLLHASPGNWSGLLLPYPIHYEIMYIIPWSKDLGE